MPRHGDYGMGTFRFNLGLPVFGRLLSWGRSGEAPAPGQRQQTRSATRVGSAASPSRMPRSSSTASRPAPPAGRRGHDLGRVAVLVAMLDSETAARLLAEMPPQTAERVRTLAADVSHVPRTEREAILREFLTRQRTGRAEATRTASLARESDGPSATTTARTGAPGDQPPRSSGSSPASDGDHGGPEPTDPLERLLRLRDQDVAELLADEPIQAVAVLCEILPPERAGGVLAQLSAAIRDEVLRRFEHAESAEEGPASEITDELAASLWEKHLRRQVHRRRRDQADQLRQAARAAQGVPSPSPSLPSSSVDESASAEAATPVSSDHTSGEASVTSPSGPQPRERTPPSPSVPERRLSPESVATAPAAARSRLEVTRREASLTFADVASLNNPAWSVLFDRVPAEVIWVALAGAEPGLIDRLTGKLSRVERQAFNARIEAVYPVRVAEIDIAQTHLAQVASELILDGRISDLPVGTVLRSQGRFYGQPSPPDVSASTQPSSQQSLAPRSSAERERSPSGSSRRLTSSPIASSVLVEASDHDEEPDVLPFPTSASQPEAEPSVTVASSRRLALMRSAA